MANRDAPHGFLPVRTKGGTCPPPLAPYALAAANSAIFMGDVVVLTAAGFVDRGAAAPAAGTLLGVAAEDKAASAGGTIKVWDDPDIVFEAQTDDTTGTATAQTCIGNNIDIIATAGSGGHSNMELDESTSAVAATLPFKIVGLHKVVGNSFGQFNRLLVVLNPSVLKGNGATGI